MKRLLLLLSLSLSLFAAGRDLGPRAIAPTAYMTQLPSVAANANGRFLTVWVESMGVLGTHIKGAFSDASGRRISATAFTVVPNVQTQWLRVAASGNSFAVFWFDNGTARMATLDAEGRATNVRALPIPVNSWTEVAGNGSHFLMVTKVAAFQTQAIFLDHDGSIVRREDVDPFATEFRVLPQGNTFVVVLSNPRLSIYRITATDGITTAHQVEGTVPPGTMSRPLDVVAARTENGTLVVWSYGVFGPSTSDLHSVLMRDDGSLTNVHIVTRQLGILTPHALMRDGSGALLAFTHQTDAHAVATIRTMRLDANGAMTGSETDGPDIRTQPGAATNGNVILLAGSSGVQFIPRVSAVVIGTDGTPRDPEMLSLAFARQHQPILGSGNNRFLAMWSEHEGDAAYLRSTLLDRDGTPSQRPTAAASFLATRDLAFNGSEYLAVHRSGDKLLVTRIDANGAAIDAQPIVLEAPHSSTIWWEKPIAVAWTGAHWMVLWPNEHQIMVSFVSSNGVATTPRALGIEQQRPPLPDGQYRRMTDVAVAYDGARALLVWNEQQYEICYFPICGDLGTFTFATHLSADGAVLETPIELPSADRPSVATSGREFVVVSGTKATVVRNNRLAIITTGTLPGIHGTSDVAFDGRDYLVAVRYQVANWYLRVHRIDAELRGTVEGIQTLAPDRFDPPSIAALPSREVLIAIQEGTPETGARATVYREDELHALPAPPKPPANVRITREGLLYVYTWDAPDDPVEQYFIEEVTPEGIVWRAGPAGPDVRQVKSPYRDVRIRARNAGGESAPAPEEPIPSRRRAVGRR